MYNYDMSTEKKKVSLAQKIKADIQYILRRDPHEKLKGFMLAIIIVSAVCLALSITIATIGIVVVAKREWMQSRDIWNICLGFAITDLVFVVFWLALVILSIVVSTKVGKNINGKALNISYISLLSVFVALGIVIIVLLIINLFGFISPGEDQRWTMIHVAFALELIRGAILVAMLVLACYYRHILKKVTNNKK